MTDFLTRLAKRTLGLMPKVEPSIPSLFTSESSQGENSGHWTDVLTRENVLLSSKIQPSIPSLFTPESNQGGISGRGTDGLTREPVLLSSEQSLSLTAKPPSDSPLDVPEAVGEFGKPNPPAPFPPPPAPSYKEGEKEKLLFSEGGAGLPSPLKGGVGGEVRPLINLPTVSVPLQAGTQEKVSSNLPPPDNTTTVNPVVNSALGVTPGLETSSDHMSEVFRVAAQPSPNHASPAAASDRANQGDIEARLDPPQPPLLRGEKVVDTRQRGIMPGIESLSSVEARLDPPQPPLIRGEKVLDTMQRGIMPGIEPPLPNAIAQSNAVDFPASTHSLTSLSSGDSPTIQSQRLEGKDSDEAFFWRSQVEANTQSANPTHSSSASQLPTPAPTVRRESQPISSVRSQVEANTQSANPTHSTSTSQLPTPAPAPRRESEEAFFSRAQVEANTPSANPTHSTSTSQLPTPAPTVRRESEPVSSVRSPIDAPMPVIPQSSSVNVPESLEFPTSTTHISLPQDVPLGVRETSERKLSERSPAQSATMMPQPPLVNAPQSLTSSFPGLDTPLTPEAKAIAQPLSRQQARLLKIDALRAVRSESLNPTSWPSQSPPESPPTIQVTIGRVEVRVSNSSPPPRPRSPRRNPSLSLNDYLQQRNERSL